MPWPTPKGPNIMSERALEIRFTLAIAAGDCRELAAQVAAAIAAVPGLRWKLRTSDAMPDVTAIARGPIGAAAAA
jgi:hypothetical protein